jgi:hypothetical protein
LPLRVSLQVTVVLVNLLIALMSSRYEAVNSEGRQIWLTERIKLFQEYKDDRGSLPPPLNIFPVIFVDLPYMLGVLFCSGDAKHVRQVEHRERVSRGWKLELRAPRARFECCKMVQRLRDDFVASEVQQAGDEASLETLSQRTRALDDKVETVLQAQPAHRAELRKLADKLDKLTLLCGGAGAGLSRSASSGGEGAASPLGRASPPLPDHTRNAELRPVGEQLYHC